MDPYLATMMLAATTGGITVPSAEVCNPLPHVPNINRCSLLIPLFFLTRKCYQIRSIAWPALCGPRVLAMSDS
jgi:hypothetical protein